MCSFMFVDCADCRHVTRSARRGRFAPAGLASRAPSGLPIVQNGGGGGGGYTPPVIRG